MKQPLRLLAVSLIVSLSCGVSAASAQVATTPSPLGSLQSQISACLTPAAGQSDAQTQAACVSLMQLLVALVLQLRAHSQSTAPVPQKSVNIVVPTAPITPVVTPTSTTAAPSGTPRLEIATSSLDSVKLNFYAMPPQTRIILIEPSSGSPVVSAGFSMLEQGRNGSVVFPMSGDFAGKSFAFRAESSSTKELIAVSTVFTVPAATVSQDLGTFNLYDGEVLLASFPQITYSNADSRCKSEKASHPSRNTRCTFNGASFDF